MRWVRRNARWLLVGYAIFLALALFSPSSEHQSGAVAWLAERLREVGVSPAVASFSHLEVATNVALVVPLSFLGSLVVNRWTWRDWTAWTFVGAVVVESLQGLLLPGRTATFSDVVANTLGGLVGACLASGLLSSRPLPRRR
jgi:glycopeptide antibiotics resistance protein